MSMIADGLASPAETTSAVGDAGLACLPGSSMSARAPRRGAAISGREAVSADQQREVVPDVEALDAMDEVSRPDLPKQESVPRAAGSKAAYAVPGASAETVSVAELWNSQMRFLLQSAVGPLKSFAFSTFTSQARRSNKVCTLGAVWPLPLPHPSTGKDRKPIDHALNNMIIVMNWLHLGGPSKVPDWYSARTPLSGEQRGIVRRMRRLCSAWESCPAISAADMGRTADKLESLQETLATLSKAAVQALGTTGSGRLPINRPAASAPSEKPTLFSDVQLAKEIEADRLTFGGVPSFNPTALLDEETKKIYTAPMTNSMAPESYDGPACKGHVRGSRSEVMKLLKKLDQSGRLSIFYPHQVRMQHRAGLFSLLKNQEQDRLILDSRGANALEEGLSRWTRTMASPIPLQDIILHSDEHLEASGEDLRDYYYLYQVSEERACRNAIAIQLSLAEARQFKSFSGLSDNQPFYVPALKTLAMGDINAVGQESHMVIAHQAGFTMEEFVTMKGKFPRAGWGVGIIIDEFVIIEAVREDEESKGVSRSAEMADMMVASYKNHGLVPHDKKRFRQERNPKFWGALVEGEVGLLRAQLERTLPITNITMRLAKLGKGTRKLLEILSGAWTSIMQFRRRGMCLMAAIFDEIQSHSYEEVFVLPVAVVQELWMMAILAPLLCSDLRAQPNTEISLVDASGEFRAEVSSQLPYNIAAELTRHRLTKAAWSRLLSPIKAWQRLHGRLSPEDEVPAGEALQVLEV